MSGLSKGHLATADYRYAENLGQRHTGSLISENLGHSQIVDAVGH